MVDPTAANAADSVVATPVSAATQSTAKTGIGGWLLLPVIVVLVQPFAFVIEVVKAVLSSSLIYWPALGIDILLGVLAIRLALALFRKRTDAPIMFVRFSALAFVLWSTASSVLPPQLFVPKGSILVSGGLDSTRAMLVAFIWGSTLVPYFLFSRRVRDTFIQEPDIEYGQAGASVGLWQTLVRRRAHEPRLPIHAQLVA